MQPAHLILDLVETAAQASCVLSHSVDEPNQASGPHEPERAHSLLLSTFGQTRSLSGQNVVGGTVLTGCNCVPSCLQLSASLEAELEALGLGSAVNVLPFPAQPFADGLVGLQPLAAYYMVRDDR